MSSFFPFLRFYIIKFFFSIRKERTKREPGMGGLGVVVIVLVVEKERESERQRIKRKCGRRPLSIHILLAVL